MRWMKWAHRRQQTLRGLMARHFPLPQAANEGKHKRIIASHLPGTF
jgi:hypothetical protein